MARRIYFRHLGQRSVLLPHRVKCSLKSDDDEKHILQNGQHKRDRSR